MTRTWKANISRLLVCMMLWSTLSSVFVTNTHAQATTQQTSTKPNINWSMVKPLGQSPTSGWQGYQLGQLKLTNDGDHLHFQLEAAHAEEWQHINIALNVNDADSNVSSNPSNHRYNYEGTTAKPSYHITMEAKAGGKASLYRSGSASPLLSSSDLKGASFEVAPDRSRFTGSIPLKQLGLQNGDKVKAIAILSGDRADEHGVFDAVPETAKNTVANDWNMKANPNRMTDYSEAYVITHKPKIDGSKDSLWEQVPDLGISVTNTTHGIPGKLGSIKLTNDGKQLYVWVDAELPNWGDQGPFINIALNVNEADSAVEGNPWNAQYNFSGADKKPQYHLAMRLKQDQGIEGAALYDAKRMSDPILATWADMKGAQFAASGKEGFEAAIPLHHLQLKNGDQVRPHVVLSGNKPAEHGAFQVIPNAAGNELAKGWNQASAQNVQSTFGNAYVINQMNDQLELISTVPADFSKKIEVEQPITLTYSEAITVVNTSGVILVDDKGNAVAADIKSDGQQLVIKPVKPLAYKTPYQVKMSAHMLEGMDTKTRNEAYSFSFTTKEQPALAAAIADQNNVVSVALKDIVPGIDYGAFALYNGGTKLKGTSMKGSDDQSIIIQLDEPIADVSHPYIVRYEGAPQGVYADQPVTMRGILDTYVYSGDDLGVTYTKTGSTFKVWAPTAATMTLSLYDTADMPKETPTREIPMQRDASTGVWSGAAEGDLNNKYYMYKVTFPDGKVLHAIDPYARASSVNSAKSAVVDLAATNPVGWENDSKPEMLEPTDAIIYELHTRDFSIDSNSGVSEKNRGKFTAFTEEGTKLKGDAAVKTGVDHLKELGITHVHLLPTYDFGSVNEKKVDDPTAKDRKFNWGYDPVNYNVPEGSYATDSAQEDPAKRIREFKQMVQAMHKNDLRLVLDVVYNHTFVTGQELDLSVFDKLVPGYYYRTNNKGELSNGSGVGNEVATDRPMVSKYVRDSVEFWAEEYKVDGFRFDLMKLIDLNTTRGIVNDLKAIDPSIIVYGEPWAGGSTPLPADQQIEKGTQRGEGFAVFNDNFRGAIKGGSDDASKGFATGEGSREAGIVNGVIGSTNDFTSSPTETINYVTAHDNLNMWDKMLKAQGKDKDIQRDPFVTLTEANILDNPTVKSSLLANGIVLTSQGIPFIHAGDEMLRSKFGDHNSYQSPDSINQMLWQQKKEYKPVFDYTQGLIELRRSHPAFRMTSKEAVASSLEVYRQDSNVVAFKLKEHANGDAWRNIVVIYNGNADTRNVALPSNGKWNVVVDHTAAGVKPIRTVEGGKVDVAGTSMMVLYDEANTYTAAPTKMVIDAKDIALEPTTSKQVTGKVLDQKGNLIRTAKVTWTSSDESIVTVDSKGKITAVKEGKAVLTASSGPLQAQVNVNVAKLVQTKADLKGKSTVWLNQTVPFTVEVKDQFDQLMPTVDVKWSSSEPAVAQVDRVGKVTGFKEGTTTITATAGSVSASMKVTVKPLLKRYIELNYVRPDKNYKDWSLWVWQTGIKDDEHLFKKFDNGMATALIEIGPDTEKIGFIIKKGNWEQKDTDSDRFVVTNVNDTLTKVYVYSGKTEMRTIPPVTGPVLEDGSVTFHYRDQEIFQSGEPNRISDVKININGTLYPMNYDAENERCTYTLKDAKSGKYVYTFHVTKDGKTAEITDPYNTENGQSIVEYKKPAIQITGKVKGDSIHAGQQRLLQVAYQSSDTFAVREIAADLSELGGLAHTKIDLELMEQSITVAEHVKPGQKSIPITLIDEYGNKHMSTTNVTVKAKPKANGKLDFDWDEARIYFVLTDRFSDGDKKNNGTAAQGYDKNHLEAYQGGDFRGLINKLDYLEDLGVNTLWITPIVDNIDFNQGTSFNGKQYGYHGYWAKDFTKIDEHLGDVETFKELINKAHDRGIKIMVDVVLNHTGYGLKPGDTQPGVTEQDKKRFEHMLRTDAVSGDPVRGELAGLPDFKTEDPKVREQVIAWQTDWIERTRTKRGDTIDYFRVDTVKHVDETTWKAFRNELTQIDPEFKLIGEYFGASVDNTGSYLKSGQMDSLLDFDFKGKAKDFVNGQLDAVEKAMQEREARMDETATMGQFLSSHDEDGFLSHYVNGDKGKLMVAAALQITAKGQPVIYYGEELGRSGANARDMSKGELSENRGAMPWDQLKKEKKLHNHYSKLLNIRADYSKLFSKGDRTKLAGSDAEGFMVFAKSYKGESVVVGLNPSEQAKKQVKIKVPYKPGTKVKDVYNNKQYKVEKNGTVTVNIPAKDDGGTIILVKK
ncbi:type I pullulanase [Paenibacillus arenosi]|uniref:pullulanase n=1 Tax=Paenibacillus arenosi TaxID=2774142 RepID=A0ABR9B200_9BACL|nr:type I pullulanase [Paenibacillus arenosi]MBD8500400.1 type I pullulanase [Paenibacillus arenosi]